MRWIKVFALLAVIALAACQEKQDQDTHKMDPGEMKQEMTASGEKVIYYTCPMEEHKQIHSAEPGKCSECGMELVAGVVTTEDKMEYWGCPMLAHSHVRQAEAGKCAECGMFLKPMRLVTETEEKAEM
ncbi:hypothetical protein KC799_25530 [candidate division KSB1 bacterium]|nr:hypothetical protein [candidate division KSB1 bacterium]